jgi:hypothetical protein
MRLIAITASAAALCLIAAVPAAAAGAGTATTNLASATISIPDIAFDGSECVRVPVTTTYTKTGGPADSVSLDIELQARQPGSSSADTASDYIGLSEPASGTRTQMGFTMCPSSYNPKAGNYAVTGTMRSEFEFARGTTASFPAIELGVVQNKTTMSPIRLKKSAFDLGISGTATAATLTKGDVGAGGEIRISIKKPGSKKWVSGNTAYTNSFGDWSSSLSPQKKGTQIQATLVNCGWCTDASRTVKSK